MHSNRSTNDSYHSDSSLRPKIKDKLTARIFLKPKKVKRSKTVVDVQKDVKLTVDKLRSRKLIKKTDITSKLASQVIKEYITPMFEADYKEKNIQNRAQAYGTRKSLPKSNLKLSDILSKQLKSLLKQKQHTENEYNRTISDTEKIKAEIDTCNQNLIEKLTFLKTIHYQYSETYKFNKLESLNLSYVNQDIVKNKNVLEGVERERDELAKELVREIEINEELNHESVELQHWNSAYKMTNDIMGESLKGLYFGISEISSCKFQEYLQNLIRNLTANLLSIQELEDFSENLLPQILLDNNKMVKESNQMSRSRDNLISDLKKLRLAVNDNLEDLKSKVKHTAQENENLNQRCVDMEKKTGDLNDEYNKIVEKLREMLPKQRLYGQYEEKLCKKCNVIFTESNNFNWSCASHKSE